MRPIRADIAFPTHFIDMLVQSPMGGVPHLPPSIGGITVDQALDLVAATFGGIVVVASCPQPAEIDLDWWFP